MTYDFYCRKCHTYFEKQMTLSEYDTKKVHCPKCQSTKVRREYKPVEIRFNGPGFYVTDNKRGK